MVDHKLERTLSPVYPKMKMISDTLANSIAIIILAGVFWLYYYFAWPTWAFWVLIALLAFTVAGTLWSFVEPELLYRSWSYQWNDEYLQLSYGVLKKEWVTLPMTKIQSVSTVQGPLMKRYNTRSVKVETMGSSYTIPGLNEGTALSLREVIAEYAKLKEVDE
ncbi:PH domain-containing protein [Salimicrobium sp. PL1-032A]|uniref:PH domain-containing protein n=1 Tax=Salimicrobium sp. PL1-032A TaxID=3095364 RepID=UPI003261822F